MLVDMVRSKQYPFHYLKAFKKTSGSLCAPAQQERTGLSGGKSPGTERPGCYRLSLLAIRLCAAVLSLLFSMSLAAQDLSFASRTARPVPEWLNRATIYEVWLN